jgi:hypothetical protein
MYGVGKHEGGAVDSERPRLLQIQKLTRLN